MRLGEAVNRGPASGAMSVRPPGPRTMILSRRQPDQPKTAVLKDVARRAGVDASTVSRVLRGDDRKPAKHETRERILQVARDMGYRANGVARSLRTRRTEAIALVVPD